jgi:hypothetical protein
MTALVSVETVLLVMLLVLVAGLLRSHAAILRRLGPEGSAVPEPPRAPRADTTAPEVAGTTLTGDAVKLALGTSGPTLLAFLTSGCATCAAFWEALGEDRLPPGVHTMIVTRDADRERPARLRALAPEGIPVVMSSQAWTDYDVPGTPYFVLVDGGIRGEGVATNWQGLASLIGDAIDDQREAERVSTGATRARRVEETLAANGVGPDHPSLYPSRSP